MLQLFFDFMNFFLIFLPERGKAFIFIIPSNLYSFWFCALQGLHIPAPSNAWGSECACILRAVSPTYIDMLPLQGANNARHTHSQGDALGWVYIGLSARLVVRLRIIILFFAYIKAHR
jgi:hypothetical protein